MIKIVLGNVGSGKTASIVRYMKNNPQKYFITNIDTYGEEFKHVFKLKAEMIIKKTDKKVKRNGKNVNKYKLNIDFWKKIIKEFKNINIIIDEAHIFFNPRRSMSRLNIIMTDFLALLRRVLGSSDIGGELILITQLSRRLDIISREMATDVEYCINHYKKTCDNCRLTWIENNEMPNKADKCPRCRDFHIKKHSLQIEVYRFQNMDYFLRWYDTGGVYKSYYDRYLITDIEKVFNNYDTLQFTDMFTEF